MKKTTKSRALVPVRRKPAHLPARRRAEVVHKPEVIPEVSEPNLDGPIRTSHLPTAVDALQAQQLELHGFGWIGNHRFPKEAEAILSEPVNVDDLDALPQNGAPYLNHYFYTRWFNRAFGFGGWALVPKDKPALEGNRVMQWYTLFVEGVARAYSLGEQEYHPNNPEQSYGDAIEATYGFSLRRCAKHLGVGGEIWTPKFRARFKQDQCVMVWCSGDDKPKWRLKTDPPFWNEAGQHREARREGPPSRQREPERQVRDDAPPPRQPSSAPSGEGWKISDPQRKRLWAIARKAGRLESEIKEWLAAQGIEHTADIPKRDYDRICQAIEAPGPLGGREPGDEA